LLRVAIQGIEGSFSAEAALKMFECRLVKCRSFFAAVDAVRTFRADFAVLPFRNTICGPILPVSELLDSDDLKITRTIELEIDHVLAANTVATIDSVTGVLSHPAALRQCGKFLERYSLRAFPTSDTATAVKQVMQSPDKPIAAIASRNAAKLFGASIIAENIADAADNRTLFYAVSLKNSNQQR
jgi:prephenate dehydratase